MVRSRENRRGGVVAGVGPMTAEPYFEIDARRIRRDRRFFGWAMVGAAIVHLSLLALRMPMVRESLVIEEERELFVVRPVRIVEPLPEPEPARAPIRIESTRVVPVPDPTPFEPEPIPVETLPVPDPPPIGPVDEVPSMVPPEPTPAVAEPTPEGPIVVGDGMTPPVRLHAPTPHYTDVARRVRREGSVIVQAVIDKHGAVERVRLLRGLGFGLDQAAIEAVERWRFEPARLPDGRPVAVYYTLTVNFRLR